MKSPAMPVRRKAVCCAVSAALFAMFAPAAPVARAQTAEPARDGAGPSAAPKAASQVIVRGVRQAEQSSIDRKKNAATAIDSIVADDLGSFPDRNVAEAVSRIAGVALDRGEFGEGLTINVRGNTPDLTRVEIDGMIVASPGGTDLNGGGGGRGTELRELPSDLIASVDVIKGSTVDMVEGSLGGGVVIKTRTGLDFAKRTIVARAAGQMNTINKKVLPNLNLLFADKYLDGRLGVVANITTSKTRNESHLVNNTTDSRYGFNRDVDLDNSPEKTFALNPAALDPRQASVNEPVVYWNGSTPITSYAVNDGGNPFQNLTVKDVVERSYAANTKADCFAAFPTSGAEFNRIANPTDRARAQASRGGALQSCLAQWNDYTPQGIRYTIRDQREKRLNGDLRFDFKVNDKLTVYAKYNRMRRDIEDSNNSIGLGNIGLDTTAANYIDGPNRRLSAAAAQAGNVTLFPNSYVNRGIVNNQYLGLATGAIMSIRPDSYKVDDNHHLTEAVVSNAGFNNDYYNQFIHTETDTKQIGANYRNGAFKAELTWGIVSGDFWRYNVRSSRYFQYGPVRTYADPDGVWQYDFSGGNNPFEAQMNPNLFKVNAPTAPGQPGMLTNVSQMIVQSPRAGETRENNFKADMSYGTGDRVPFLTSLKFGLNRRTFDSKSWSATTASTVSPASNGQPAVIIPNLARTSNVTVCENNAASLAPGGTPCKYGFTPSTTQNSVGSGTYVMNSADYSAFVSQLLTNRTSNFFNGSDRGPNAIGSWNYLDSLKGWNLLGVPAVDVNCIKYCQANDGNVYEQPRSSLRDEVMAGYLAADFNVDHVPFTSMALPFGWELSGNFGYRVVRTKTSGTGSLTFVAITTDPGWNPLTNNEAVTTRTVTRNTTMSAKSTDYMPVLNLALWPVADEVVLRYNRAKTVARPSTGQLASGGVTCTYDERTRFANEELNEDGEINDSNCNGTMGNPALRPRINLNQNWSLEWYPNRDTSVSAAYFYQKGRVGAAKILRLDNQFPFADSDIGTVNGKSLADVPYTYNTYTNDSPTSRKGIELGARTAFTFLPSVLRHTGINVNFTKMKSKTLDGQLYELSTGEALTPFKELKHTWNTSLWYDDGSLNMRLSLQVNSDQFWQFQTSNANTRNFPAAGIPRDADDIAFPLLPSTPWIKDASRYVDAKIGYKFKNGVEVFVEGRNLNNFNPTDSSGQFGQYTQGPMVYTMNYSGRRFLAGLTLRY